MPESFVASPDGTVHVLSGEGYTECGRDAAGWSRRITSAGLGNLCEACHAGA